MPFKVLVDDNFHYQDESERYELGSFESYEAAVDACKKIVDTFLAGAYKDGMTAEELYSTYKLFGTDPFILPDSGEVKFSAWRYAKQRCDEICQVI